MLLLSKCILTLSVRVYAYIGLDLVGCTSWWIWFNWVRKCDVQTHRRLLRRVDGTSSLALW